MVGHFQKSLIELPGFLSHANHFGQQRGKTRLGRQGVGQGATLEKSRTDLLKRVTTAPVKQWNFVLPGLCNGYPRLQRGPQSIAQFFKL